MEDNTALLIEKIAEKLGTTSDHLWGVLLHQAPISGAIDLAAVIVMILLSALAFKFVKNKTTKVENELGYKRAEWGEDGASLAWVAVIVFSAITLITILGSAQAIFAAFFNPEYWALSHIIGWM